MITWKLIKVGGKVKVITPAKGDKLSLEELQSFVGGYVRPIILKGNDEMWVNEEGLLNDLPMNPTASEMVNGVIVGDVVLKIVTRNPKKEVKVG